MSSSPVGFADLTERQQVRRLRDVAVDVLDRYGIVADRLRLLQHAFNTTFRVDTSSRETFALRLNVHGRRTSANVTAEVQWLSALSNDLDVGVPRPLPTADGSFVAMVDHDAVGWVFPAVVVTWLPGRDVDAAPNVEAARAAGRAMALLHEQAAEWRPTGEADLPLFDDVFWGVSDGLSVDRLDVSSADLDVLRAVVDRSAECLDGLFARERARVIHGDLHDGNMKWCRGRLSILDFDDCGWGLPVQDLAIATYYHRPRSDLVDAMIAGYESVRALPECSPDEFETLVAHRNLLLLEELLQSEHPEFRRVLPVYVHNTVTKLRDFLDTGTYRHDLDGLLPIG